MTNPKYTFIIPVYNADKELLKRCLDSVLYQTVDDWELIAVDDGSTDDTPAYLDEIATQDERFRVIHKPNGRVASARNCGLDNAKGQWIQFIDQDDYIAPDNLEQLNDRLDDSLDYILFNPIRHMGDEEKEIIVRPLADDTIFNKEQHRQYILDMLAEGYEGGTFDGGFVTVWGILYRKSFIDRYHLRSPEELTIADDVVFHLDCCLHAEKIKYCRIGLYHRVIIGSSDGNSYHPEITVNDRKFIKELRRLFPEDGNYPVVSKEDVEKAFVKRYVICLLGITSFDMCHRNNPKSSDEKMQALKNLISEDPYKYGLKHCKLKWFGGRRRKISVLLLKLNMVGMYFRFYRK